MIKNKLIKFGASWCAPCKSASKYLQKFDPDKYVEYDVMEDTEISEKFGVRNVPTFVLVNVNGDPIDRFNGFIPKLIDEAIAKIK